MADDASATASIDAQAPAATTATDSTEPTSDTTAHTNGDSIAPVKTNEESQTPAEQTQVEEAGASDEKTQQADSASAEPTSDATPASGSKDKKRKSVGGVPEHKNKKLNKKKSMPTLRLECKAGEFYWARLKGYPPWPSIVCDEEMLPESLLATRPVSTARPDGSLRDDFKEGGKNAKERTFPIMFLHTNEFQWMVNTSLTPLEPAECLELPKTKMAKNLQEAYKVAAEGHGIDYYKDILRKHQQEMDSYAQAEAEAEEQAALDAAAKAESAEAEGELASKDKKKKKTPRKSKAADEDVEMDDADAPKSTKKRKKAEDSEADTPKPKKTPKVTKLNAPKTPNGETSATKKTKSKKKVVSAPKIDEEQKPQMTDEERLATREKAVLYLRHRLQKGFLARDSTPKEDEMASMADHFGQLEAYDNLEPSIIRTTKIHKVLKAIVKLASVPKDDEFQFKKRSSVMLEMWNKRLETDGDQPGARDKDQSAATTTVVESEAPQANGASLVTKEEVAEKDMAEAETSKAEAGKEAEKDMAEAGTSKAEAEEGAAKPIESQEIEMQDAEASEKPAENATAKEADAAADSIEEKVEEVFQPGSSADTKADQVPETLAAPSPSS